MILWGIVICASLLFNGVVFLALSFLVYPKEMASAIACHPWVRKNILWLLVFCHTISLIQLILVFKICERTHETIDWCKMEKRSTFKHIIAIYIFCCITIVELSIKFCFFSLTILSYHTRKKMRINIKYS